MNDTDTINTIINNSTLKFINESRFIISEPEYLYFSDIVDTNSAINFYKACFICYPHIFITVCVLSFIISYYCIKEVLKQ